ncbi:hypothetical protein [Pseudomonas coronafaciens]|uniref:hypothetical protein n=1 Tax=Pseudomonas coronafaciens TaxID=53409 RepID=UPI0016805F81|nr:hypothetical protein [Pseudomonas coronafaciens]
MRVTISEVSLYIKSGSKIPKLVITDSPLVKIVPVRKEVSDYSPFFTTMDELRRASQSKATLADLFGLPLTSEASKYSVFEITPIKPTEVFVSKVAPTTEFGGSVARSGDVFQSIVTNRGEWSAPKLIGTLDN